MVIGNTLHSSSTSSRSSRRRQMMILVYLIQLGSNNVIATYHNATELYPLFCFAVSFPALVPNESGKCYNYDQHYTCSSLYFESAGDELLFVILGKVAGMLGNVIVWLLFPQEMTDTESLRATADTLTNT